MFKQQFLDELHTTTAQIGKMAIEWNPIVLKLACCYNLDESKKFSQEYLLVFFVVNLCFISPE